MDYVDTLMESRISEILLGVVWNHLSIFMNLGVECVGEFPRWAVTRE